MAIVLAGAAATVVVWAVASTSGTRWLLTSATRYSGVSLSAKKIEGRIIGHLLLTDVRVGLAQQKLEIDRFELRWKTLPLLAGTVAVQEVILNGVRIQDDTPPDNKQPILLWPRMPRIVQLFDGTIERFRVTNLSYRLLHEEPMLVTSIDTSVSWQDDLLFIGNLDASSPFGRISGSISAGFDRPSLTAELAIVPAHPVAEMDRFSLHVQRSSGTAHEQIVGMVTFSGSAGSRKLLELTGDVGMVREAFNLRRLHLTRPGQRGVVTAEGSLAFTPRESVLSLQVKAAGLDLARELNVPTDLSGTLRFAGTLDSYRGDFTLSNQAQGWQAATVSAAYHGTSEGVKLEPFSARVLDGSLAGSLDMSWRAGFAMQGAISGRNLNPARFDPEWKGVANFNADGKLALTGKEPAKGSVRVTLLESRLHGQALSGDLQADFAGSNLSLTRLALQGKGFDLHAAGELNQRLNLEARISDFSRLVPGSAGALQAGGWVRWRDGHLTGAVAGTGNNLAYDGNRIAAASLTARLEQGAGYPLQIAATLRDVVHGRYKLNAATLAADGTLQRHTVNATLRSDGSAAQLTLSAGYDSGLWKGQITRLAGSDGTGSLNLAAPATFAVSAEKFFLSPLVLTTAATERLEVAADLALNPLNGQIQGQWTDLNLARANSFLQDGRISGSSRGTVRVGFLPGKRLTLAGKAAASGTFTAQGHSITVEQSLVTFDGSEQGLQVGVELSAAAGARFKGVFSSPAPLRMAMPEKGKLTAELSGFDLALLKPWLPGDTRIAGRISSLTLSAGYDSGLWKGQISGLAGSDGTGPLNLAFPATFALSPKKFFLSPLVLTTVATERLEVAADLALNPLNGQIRVQWTDLNLARANSFLQDGRISGSSRGTVRVGFLPGKRLTLAGNAASSGTFTAQGHSMTVEESLVTFDGSEKGMRVGVELGTADGGRLKGNFSSPAPLRMAMPEEGKLTAELSRFDLELLKPWLPGDTRVAGRISSRAKGNILPGQSFELDGDAELSGGELHQKRPDGDLALSFPSALASWGWRGEALDGTLVLTMADHGQAGANFQLPVPARFPVAINPKGPLRASFTGQFQEKGIVSVLFPDLIQKSSGEIDAALAVSGTWEAPEVGGTLRLTKAGAYLPTAGINLKDVQLAASLEKNLIRIDSYRAVSGPGHIEGTAVITLAGRRVSGYQGTIRGANFQTFRFPELQILSTPKLSFEGTPQKLTVRGELLLPELRIAGAPSSPKVIAPSSDVILEGSALPLAASSPLALDVQVRVVLGEKVFVKIEGIDAQLGGAMDLSFSSLERINSSGEIKVVKGRYRTYGVNLEIVRGRLFFAGGSIDRPTLDFLALRTIGDVRAGVTVTGTIREPVTRLYSEPAMPDVDVLAYIVLGHPLGSSGEQAGLLAQAAGALLTSGQAEVLQDKLKDRLGLSTLEIKGGVGATTGHMGYKPLPVTPPGAIPATQQPGMTETMLTVGKYLTPQLYISYGKSVFTGGNLFLLRYDIFKHWQVETQTGSESGADLYYKLEFK